MTAAPQLAIIPVSSDSRWITAAEALELTGRNYDWLRQQVCRGKVVSRQSSRISANGRPEREYLASSLPMRTSPTALAIVPPPAAMLGPLFAQTPAPSLERVTLPNPKDQAQAQKHYDLIKPLLTYAENRDQLSHLRLKDGTPVTTKTRLIDYLAEIHGVSARKVKFWEKRFREGGPAALARSKRSDRGRSRWAIQTSANVDLAELAAYACLNENLPTRMVWELVESKARQSGLPVPSYETVRRMLKRLNRAAVTLSKEGRAEYDKIFAPYIRRGYEDFDAGEIVVSDHMIHDVLVQNTIYDDCGRELIRLRFTGLEDMRSRRFTAYAWSQEGSSRSITTVLRHHLEGSGRFRLLYCDNGKDYRKVGKGARGGCWYSEDIPLEAQGVVRRIGAEIKYCQPYHPQAKLIERANNTIHQRFDRRWISYCGPKPELRPDKCTALMERHAKLLAAGRVEESEIPTAHEFIRAAIAWIEGEYNRHTMNVEGMRGLTPLEAWDQHHWQGASEPVDQAALAPLLLDRTSRLIRRGRIELGPHFYVAADPQSSIQLHDRSGQSAIVLYDVYDDSTIAAADENGYIFAYLRPEKLLRQSDDPETRADIAAIMQERGAHYKRTRGLGNDLARRVQASGYIPQNDQMLAIGNLPIAIDDLVVHRPHTKTRLKPDTTAVAPASAMDIAAQILEDLKR